MKTMDITPHDILLHKGAVRLMNKFMEILENRIMPPMAKLAEQRHLKAIRNGIIITMPLIIVGSLFLVLLNLPIETAAFSWKEFIGPYFGKLVVPFRLTVGLTALYAAFGIGAALGRIYKLDQVTSGVLATLGFLCTTIPVNISGAYITAATDAGVIDGVAQAGTAINLAGGDYLMLSTLGAAGLFGSIVASIVSVEIYNVCKKRNLTIKMPEGVPSSVANSFAVLIPAFLVVMLFWTIRVMFNFDINAFITQLLSPISSFVSGNNIFGVYVLAILITLFWSAGLHGVSLVGAVARPFWEVAITENMDAFAAGSAIPNMYTEQFFQWFVWIGGSGATIGLAILMAFFAKSQYLKQLGRVTFVPSLFNINEPIIFGAPIVMNPILIIPFILAPLVMITTAALAMNFGLVGPMVARAPWTLPGPIGAAMSVESGAFFAFLLCVVNIIIAVAIYFPFFKAYDKQMVSQETETVSA